MEPLELSEDRAIANVPARVRYVGAFPIRLRAVRNDGAGHRLEDLNDISHFGDWIA